MNETKINFEEETKHEDNQIQSSNQTHEKNYQCLADTTVSKSRCNVSEKTKNKSQMLELSHLLSFLSDENLNDFSRYSAENKQNENSNNHIIPQTKTHQKLWIQKEVLTLYISTLNKNSIANLSNLSFNNSNLKCNATISNTNLFNCEQDLSVFSKNQKVLSSDLFSKSDQVHSGIHFPIELKSFPLKNQCIGNNMDSAFFADISLETKSNKNLNIQQHTESEKLNREYLSIRRFQNPIVKSLKRINIMNSANEISITRSREKNSHNSISLDSLSNIINHSQRILKNNVFFMDQESIDEINILLNILWLDTNTDLSPSSFPTPKKKIFK